MRFQVLKKLLLLKEERLNLVERRVRSCNFTDEERGLRKGYGNVLGYMDTTDKEGQKLIDQEQELVKEERRLSGGTYEHNDSNAAD